MSQQQQLTPDAAWSLVNQACQPQAHGRMTMENFHDVVVASNYLKTLHNQQLAQIEELKKQVAAGKAALDQLTTKAQECLKKATPPAPVETPIEVLENQEKQGA